MLAIKVEYLTGVCVATRHDDPSRSAPEWPPHPDRLFSALVAAAGDMSAPALEIPGPAKRALQWLLEPAPEGAGGAPQVWASEAHDRLAPDVHMPTNPHPDEIRKAVRGILPVYRKKAALPVPAVIPDEPVAYFIWRDADPAGHLDELRQICERVTYLGRSRSLVRVAIADDPPPPTHVPGVPARLELRVPDSGRLAYLIEKYKRDGGKPAPCVPQPYRWADSTPQTDRALPTVFDRCWVFRPQPGDPPLPAVSTLKVTQALRKALIACIEDDQRSRHIDPNVPEIVHGHGKHPHCAYVALPFVHPFQRHADGTIKGLAILLPRSVGTDTLLTVARGLVRLQQNGLGIPKIGTWHVEEVPADDPPNATLDPRIWNGASRVWATATPMAFGHFPKPSKGGEAKVILDSLRMIGIDPERAVGIAVGRHSPLHGAPPSWCFKAPGNTPKPPLWLRHVTLRFDQPMRGPIVLGSMRYFGLGLMRPVGAQL